MYNLRVKNTTMSISIRKVNVGLVHRQDIPKVVDYLVENYFGNEPLVRYAKLMDNPDAVDFLRKFCNDILRENISVVATTSEGDVAAVSCNAIVCKGGKTDFGNCPEVRKIADFITQIADESDIYEKYPDVEEYMHVAFMSVHEDFRKQGLAKRLLEQTRELALKLGLKLMRIDCCTLETAKWAQKEGFTCLKEIQYDEYKIDGESAFVSEEPDGAFGVYAMKTEHFGFLKSSS